MNLLLNTDLEKPAINSRFNHPFFFWIPAVFIVLTGFIIRVVNAAKFKFFMQDEFYYVKDGWSLFNYGYEVKWIKDATDLPNIVAQLNASNNFFYNNLTPMPYSLEYWSLHPPLGKWIIGLGLQLFGIDEPLGWRFGAIMAGTAIIALTIWLTHQLFNNRAVSLIAGGMVALDGFNLSMSIVSMLDIFVALFAVLTINIMLFYIQRYARLSSRQKLLMTILIGLSAGLTASVKWSGAFIILPFGFYMLYRFIKIKGERLKQVGYIATSGLVMIVTYLSSYAGWFLNSPDGLKGNSLLTSLNKLLSFQRGELDNAFIFSGSSAFKSTAEEWLLASYPSYFAAPENYGLYIVSTIPNLAIWHLGLISIIITLFSMARSKKFNWVLLTPILGVASLILPWFAFSERVIYQWYAIMFAPLIIVYAAKLLFDSFKKTKILGSILLGLIIIVGTIFYPINSGIERVKMNAWESASLQSINQWYSFTLDANMRNPENTALYFRPDAKLRELEGHKTLFFEKNGVYDYYNVPIVETVNFSSSKIADTSDFTDYDIFQKAYPDLVLYETDNGYVLLAAEKVK